MLDVEHDPLLAEIYKLSFCKSRDAMAMLAADGSVLLLNDGARSAFDLQPVASDDRFSWVDLWSGEARADAVSALAFAVAGNTAAILSARAARSDPRRFWTTTITPLADASGTVRRLLAVSREVTVEREAASALDRSAQVHKALVASISEIVWHYDVASGITDRQGWFEFTGRADNATDFDDWLSFLHPEDREEARIATDQAMADRCPLLIEYRLRHRSGGWRWVEDRATPLLLAGGTIAGWVGIISDIHDRRVAEAAVRTSERRLRLAVEATGIAIWEIDVATGDQSWSPELYDMLHLPKALAPGREPFLNHVHPEDRRSVGAVFEASSSAGREVATSTFRLLLPSGEERWIEARSRLFLGDQQSTVRHVGTLQDITVRKQAEREIWLAAHQDALTRAANRTLFQVRLDAAISLAGSAAGSVGIVMVDLDNFKDVNDNLGHDAGDALLRATAERLMGACPSTATVARLGGDEFGLVVPMAAGDPPLAAIVETCLMALRQPVEHQGERFRCTASLGWALYPEHGLDPASLLKSADLALYAVKAGGRNAARGFEPRMRSETVRRFDVFRAVGDALARDGIVPFYQPKVSLVSGRILGFEALMRWRDEAGLHGPGEIGEALDDATLAMRLGTRMVERIVSDMRAWTRAGLAFGHVALNVGAREFGCEGDRDLPTRLSRALADAGLPASCLHVEITERVLLDEEAHIIAPALHSLREAGIAIALDDFGTGYASLTQLRHYPISYLKIDRSFVAQMAGDAGALAMVRALVKLARNLRMDPVAEGVETAAQIALLRAMGCDAVQGYAFAKPMAAARVPRFLATFDGQGCRDKAHRATPRRLAGCTARSATSHP